MEKDIRAYIFNGFGILASIIIIIGGSIIPHAIVDLLVQVFGALMIIWALLTVMVEKKHTPSLPKGYFFIEHGPYEILRHPVYAGYLLIMISFVETEFTPLRLISFLILCIAIWLKIIREEFLMNEKVERYSDYKKKTKALIPYLL